jgi:hypothetical protein
VFTGNAQRPAPARWSRRWDYDYRNNRCAKSVTMIRSTGVTGNMTAPGVCWNRTARPRKEQWRWDAAGNPLDNSLQQSVRITVSPA